MEHSTAELARVAGEAVQASGDYLRATFRDGPVDAEFSSSDVKAAADHESEDQIREVIETHYPDHVFHGEESEAVGDGDYRWVVDPLDGTNNFASGYPKFATAAAVLYRDEPVAAAIYEPLPDDLYLAERDDGARLNGEPLTAASSVPLEHGTVAFVVGLPAMRDADRSAQADRLIDALGEECKRVVPTWAPCVDWGLLARGGIEGLVCFHPDIYEQHAGGLLAAESGVVASDTVADDGIYVGAHDDDTRATLAAVVDETL